MKKISLHILQTPEEMAAVEELQRQIWSGTARDAVPHHMLLAVAQNGGVVIGAVEYEAPESETELPEQGELPFMQPASPPRQAALVGFVFGFLGQYDTPGGVRLKHCSHMLGVLPGFRSRGVGFLLKRAQWQMVRRQGLDLVTWTYDPLLSANAHLNIARLGGMTKSYHRNAYGEMSDELNAGLPTDRFEVEWWVTSRRVLRRLSKQAPAPLDLAHYLAADVPILNPSRLGGDNLPYPASSNGLEQVHGQALLLVEIPADFLNMKAADNGLAIAWRYHTRSLFEGLFERGYLVTDAIYLPGAAPRSFYVLTNGEAEIMGVKKAAE